MKLFSQIDKRELSIAEIRDIAFWTTGQSHNSDWMAHRNGKLTSSMFSRAISVINNPQSTNIQLLRDDIYAPKNLAPVAARKWCIEHESVTIEENQNMTNNVVKPTGL